MLYTEGERGMAGRNFQRLLDQAKLSSNYLRMLSAAYNPCAFLASNITIRTPMTRRIRLSGHLMSGTDVAFDAA